MSMRVFGCECRGPCRRRLRMTEEAYLWLALSGAVLAPECAKREGRRVLITYNGAVTAATVGRPQRIRHARSLHSRNG